MILISISVIAILEALYIGHLRMNNIRILAANEILTKSFTTIIDKLEEFLPKENYDEFKNLIFGCAKNLNSKTENKIKMIYNIIFDDYEI